MSRWWASLLPATLFGRTLLTLILTFGAFTLVTASAIVVYVLLPLSQRSAADLANIMVLAARTFHQLPPESRANYRRHLIDQYRLGLDEQPPVVDHQRHFFPYRWRLEQALSKRLGRPVEMISASNAGEPWFWVEIGRDIDEEPLWIGFPRSRIGTQPLLGLTIIALVAVGLILLTALILAGQVSRPVRRLAKAAEEVAFGRSPQDLPETGLVELANLARRFNQTSRQVRELLADRTLLLTGISHDLRTPLTRLRLAVAMLPEGTPPELTQRLERDIDEMNTLIGQALELGRTLGAEPPEMVELNTLLTEVVAKRSHLLWTPGPDCYRAVAVLALRRILANLVENALRYGGEQPVELRLDCQEEAVAIEVLDRGPGIPESELEAVFRPFYRLESSRNRRTGGTGLGLAVAQQLAQANRMELTLTPRPGGGMIGRVWLPAGKGGDRDRS